MRGMGMVIGLGAAVVCAAAVGCRKPADAKRSELRDAGYSWTAEDWFRAARTDQAEAVRRFLSSGFPADTRDAAGDTALHAAAEVGAESVANILLDKRLPVDQPGAGSRTPLHAAVAGDKPAMVAWLLRQGADPARKDAEGFSPLMLAVRDDRPGCVEELAPHQRDQLDDALLLASITGRTRCIDVIANYGGSVFARMDDGRTTLMLAAENGHREAAELLIDLGASRFSTADDGRAAADFAREAGSEEIAGLIESGPVDGLVGLQDEEEIAREMAGFVDSRAAGTPDGGTPTDGGRSTAGAAAPVLLQDAVVSAASPPPAASDARPASSSPAPALPPLVMRHYRETELPVAVRATGANGAAIALPGSAPSGVAAAPGATLPGSRLQVVRVSSRMETTKDSPDGPVAVPVVEVRDVETGRTREFSSASPATAHDPYALVEDAATGRRYIAAAGQRFRSEDGGEFVVSDVRPTQIVIENLSTGEVSTIRLRGPRG